MRPTSRASRKNQIIGLVGFGSGGPDGWRKEWRDQTGAEKYSEKPSIMFPNGRRIRSKHRAYVDPEDLTPWGGADDYTG